MNIQEQLIDCLENDKVFDLYLNELPDYSIEDVIQLHYCILTDNFSFNSLMVNDPENKVRGYIPDKSKYDYVHEYEECKIISWWKDEDSCVLFSLFMEDISGSYVHIFSKETCDTINELLRKYGIANNDTGYLYSNSNVKEYIPYTSEKFISIVSSKTKSARNV